MKLLLTILLLATPVMAQTTRITSGDAVSDGLVGWWPMEDNSTTTPDRSGTGNTGTLGGSPATVPGKIGSAMSFNGSSQYVSTLNTALVTTVGTISVWIKPSAHPLASPFVAILLSEQTSTDRQYDFKMQIQNSYYPAAIVRASGLDKIAASSTAIQLNIWTHLAAVWDGSFVILYTNGVQIQKTAASVGTLAGHVSDYYLAAHHSALESGGVGRYFTGSMDDVRVYNRALSDAEVSAIYFSRKHIYGGQ